MLQDQPTVVIKTGKIKKERLDVQYPIVEGLPDRTVKQYINSVIMAVVSSLIVKSGYNENPMTEVTGRYEIRTNRNGILSLSIEIYWFSGGAHGMTVLESLTFDVSTGQLFRLRDLFKENAKYVKHLTEIVKRQIQKKNIPVIVDFTSIDPDQYFYLGNNALVLYFQLYELAPYAYGFPRFHILTKEIADIIRENGPLDVLRSNLSPHLSKE